jgi:hypothetical protein
MSLIDDFEQFYTSSRLSSKVLLSSGRFIFRVSPDLLFLVTFRFSLCSGGARFFSSDLALSKGDLLIYICEASAALYYAASFYADSC